MADDKSAISCPTCGYFGPLIEYKEDTSTIPQQGFGSLLDSTRILRGKWSGGSSNIFLGWDHIHAVLIVCPRCSAVRALEVEEDKR